ncbi:hypothetical protein QWY93_10870 [Echinicola jeungdonensis]|uniref:Uncharacterized protein n=1 Tax=Echinicola jeungdonensis TaxID=709343 RepID=A0ABV5J8V5_9BACT|nr:hypothetical protein [Echinicola jeungdonensis]MDN3669826.1 hypothetical protein [Echinicola jeungdonensis]
MMSKHFSKFTYSTYSSEEPCFTCDLPQILKSFVFKYAVLKNPNTCWGGYTRGFGGELVSWRGPDGAFIKTGPGYENVFVLGVNEYFWGYKARYYTPILHPHLTNDKREIVMTYSLNYTGCQEDASNACDPETGWMDPYYYRIKAVRIPVSIMGI